MTRVLVTGATGTVGQHVVDVLSESPVSVRAASRDVAAARDRFDEAVDVVEFDFARPETWGRALDGVERLFLVRPPVVDRAAVEAFADAADRVGVAHVVYLSALGAERNVIIPHFWTERHLSGVDATVVALRASYFMQNLHEVHGADVREHDELFVPAGDGATSFVDARDVGEAAATLLADPDVAPAVYELTGPTALDYHEVAAVFSEVLGRSVTYADPSVPAFVARWLRRGEPPAFAVLMVALYTVARLGLAGRVTDDLADLLGRPPRTVREYVADYADAFRTGAARPADAPATA